MLGSGPADATTCSRKPDIGGAEAAPLQLRLRARGQHPSLPHLAPDAGTFAATFAAIDSAVDKARDELSGD